MGVDETQPGTSVAHETGDYDMHDAADPESTDVKLETVVLPEGVCLLDKVFIPHEKDPDGKKFDKVSRFICRCINASIEMLLDVNIDVYPLKIGVSLQIMVTTTLHSDGAPMPTTFTHAIYKEKTLMDDFEYVCYGRVFKIKDTADEKLQVFASFGGLIMRLIGDAHLLEKFQIDQNVYLLARTSKSSSKKAQGSKRQIDST